MSATRLNAAEKDLEKFIKFLAIKSVQVVVQSRLGTKIQTQCNPLATGNDWFNIVIEDYPDVYAETKQALNLSPGETILNRLPVCVEISLRTVDGDQMVLEVWSLDLQSPTENKSEQVLKVAHQIYNRMSILLKSLISLTRATPAYKLSRRQSSDSYRIFYKVYAEEKPQVHALGEGFKQVRVGHLNTIVGNLTMSVAYRTKMTFSPTTQHCDSAIMLKSDHFLKDQSPKHIRYHHVKKAGGEKKFIDIDKPLRPGAFVDVSKIKQYTEDDFILPATPPFDWLIKKNRTDSTGSSIHEDRTQSPLGGGNNNNNVDFKNYEQQPQSPIKSLLVPVPLDDSKSKKPSRTAIPPDDDNLLKELNFPFASPTSHVNDLARFYRDCYHAPPLHSCELNSATAENNEGGVALDPVEDLSKQLELFETSLENYEILVSQLGCSTTSSKSSSTKST
ncbi:autophagy-related protein 13 homolog [Episyrphus balteatus]|uniref:autophagy-related protein 13 homolog n=1 Tax=Episyrphus balteatus TaxID=286459 RepID=UPI002485B0BE|nr:autophagy-related protein 13 homolog [Episyrphus balteatus]